MSTEREVNGRFRPCASKMTKEERKLKQRVWNKKYHEKHPEAGAASTAKWRKKNLSRAMATARFCATRWRETNRSRAIDILGGACQKCWNMDRRVLQIDHVLHDGAAERKTLSQNLLCGRIVKGKVDISRYQILCANCNRLKTLEWYLSNKKKYT